MCPSCGNHNYADKINCNRCGVPKPIKAAPKAAGKGMRPGDWICPACNNHNYADKTACNRCGLAKPLAGQLPMSYGMMGGIQSPSVKSHLSPTVKSHLDRVSPYGQSKLPQTFATGYVPLAQPQRDNAAGGWNCPVCNNYNYAIRTNCNRCATPRQTRIGKEGLREGDWICMQCSNHNYADKMACNKCGLPKDQATTPPPKVQLRQENFREGDWICPACNNHNYANRTQCNKCAHPKP